MFLRALSAESLKYRRTSALFLAVGVPVAIELLYLLIFVLTPSVQKLPLAERWNFFVGTPVSTWVQLFLPLGMGIIAALVLGLEHQDNQWKHALVLGPSRIAVYLAKWLAVMALVLLGSIALAFSGFIVGGILTSFQSIPWLEIAKGAGLSFLGSFGIIAIQTWLSTRFRAFGISIGVALFGAILGTAASNSATYWKYIPWAYPNRASSFPSPDNQLAIGLSLALMLVVTILAAWDFRQRDIL
jgi:lantibiotic transport system permease protein